MLLDVFGSCAALGEEPRDGGAQQIDAGAGPRRGGDQIGKRRGPLAHRGIPPDTSVDRHVVRIGLRVAARIAHLYGKVVRAVEVRTGLVKELRTADGLLIAATDTRRPTRSVARPLGLDVEL